jgi:16S rRNA (guanine527-N7)-methyltransferase
MDHQSAFDLALGTDVIERLADYYALVQEHNAILHLVAPTTAEEFAVRHILESLTLLESLTANARFADVGTGAGLPSIPCLIARDDLSAVLIESKEKKTKFLEQAAEKLGFADRVQIVNRQFDEVEASGFSYVTCRALDKFTEKLPRLLKWAKGRTLLFFGGNNMRDALTKQKVEFNERLMPMSEQRYLFIVSNRK